MKKENETAKTIVDKIKLVLSGKTEEKKEEKEEKKVELAEVTTADGLVLFAEIFEAGQPIYVVSEAVQVPAPAGEYLLADGKKIVVEVEGLIGSILPATPSEAVDTPPAPAVLSKEDIATMIQDALKPVVDVLSELSKEGVTDKDKIKDLETQLSDKPASEGVKVNPDGKKKKEEAVGVKLGKREGKSTMDRVNAAMFGEE